MFLVFVSDYGKSVSRKIRNSASSAANQFLCMHEFSLKDFQWTAECLEGPLSTSDYRMAHSSHALAHLTTPLFENSVLIFVGTYLRSTANQN